MSNDSIYFAAKPADETAEILLAKSNQWFKSLDTSGYLSKLRTMWAAYHGAYYSDNADSHSIVFSGEQGELVEMAINHMRNFGQHMLNMITSVRPAMQARSINTDYKSLVQTNLANGVLDYYMRDHRLERYFKDATELAIVLGSGHVKIEWNSLKGDVYDNVNGVDIREGDIEFTTLSAFDVMFDTNREDRKHDWVIARSFKNRFDLIAKYPELRDKILKLPTKSDLMNYAVFGFSYDETDLVPVYEFYHNRTESMSEGRYLLFLDHDVVLLDSPMPYRALPIYTIAPAYYLGTPYGYTPLFDLLAPQDALNSLYSSILTNQVAFGVQNILVPRGSDVSIESLSGNLNIIEANTTAGKIEPLNLTATPKEIFDFIQMLEKVMETISGVNSVARGNPDPNLRSGNALALIQSMTLQFMSGLQESYVALVEDVGTGIVNILKDHATVPRIATIVGKNNRTYLKEFNGEDLDSINRVVVDVGNPLAKCLAEGTEVLMYDGSKKKVEDIIIGDEVMGPDSKKRTVSGINSGLEQMYEVTSKDKHRNVKYGCNESHILTLRYCSDDYRYNAKQGDQLDISVKEFLQLTDRQQRLLQGFKTGVEFSKKNLTIPPYILGSWLGDGTSASTSITTMDTEIFKEWFDYAESIGMQLRTSTSTSSGKAKTYFITSGQAHGKSDRNPMMNELRAMELINNKHIPNIYLKSSREDRLQLLAGLLDTDGHRNGETFIFTQKSDKLTQQVIYLSESLGFRTTTKKFKANSSKLVGNIEGECNKVTIGGNTWEIPTKLPRKQSNKKSKARQWLNYGIEVKSIGKGTYYGFTLKEEPHFLLGDFTVTHNTTAGKVEMAEQLLQMGVIKTPEQYFTVMNTGQLDVMTEDTQSQLFLVKSENERLINGQPVIALFTDTHKLHIDEHAAVLADPELRFDQDLAKRVTDHMQEHINLLKNTDPQTLQLLGQQPLAAPQPSPGPQNTPPGPQNGPPQQPPPGPQQGPPPGQQTIAQPRPIPARAMNGGQIQNALGGLPLGAMLNQQGAAQEHLPQPAKVNADMLLNPELQQLVEGNVKNLHPHHASKPHHHKGK